MRIKLSSSSAATPGLESLFQGGVSFIVPITFFRSYLPPQYTKHNQYNSVQFGLGVVTHEIR